MTTIEITKKEWEKRFSKQILSGKEFMNVPTSYRMNQNIGKVEFVYKYFSDFGNATTKPTLDSQINVIVTDWENWNRAEFKALLNADRKLRLEVFTSSK